MDFDFIGAGGRTPAFLVVRPGCYIRVRDISGVTVGVPETDTGKLLHDNVVFVHMVTGSGAAFDPCDSQQEATDMASALVDALVKAEHMKVPRSGTERA